MTYTEAQIEAAAKAIYMEIAFQATEESYREWVDAEGALPGIYPNAARAALAAAEEAGNGQIEASRPSPVSVDALALEIIDAAWDDGPHPDSETARKWAERILARFALPAPVVTEEMVERALAGWFESVPVRAEYANVAERIKERSRTRMRAALSAALTPEAER